MYNYICLWKEQYYINWVFNNFVLIRKETTEADTCQMIYNSQWEGSDRTEDYNAVDRTNEMFSA